MDLRCHNPKTLENFFKCLVMCTPHSLIYEACFPLLQLSMTQTVICFIKAWRNMVFSHPKFQIAFLSQLSYPSYQIGASWCPYKSSTHMKVIVQSFRNHQKEFTTKNIECVGISHQHSLEAGQARAPGSKLTVKSFVNYHQVNASRVMQ